MALSIVFSITEPVLEQVILQEVARFNSQMGVFGQAPLTPEQYLRRLLREHFRPLVEAKDDSERRALLDTYRKASPEDRATMDLIRARTV